MTSTSNTQSRSGRPLGRDRTISARTLVAAILVILVVLFILLNRHTTHISFIFFSARSSVWIALTIAACVGALAGFLLGRSRYQKRSRDSRS